MPKRWRIRPHDPDRIAALERAARVPAVVAGLLIGRGIDQPQAAEEFLAARLSTLHDPELLPGARQAAERLWDAVAAKRRIVIHGDYDADGIAGTSILLECLRLLGANVGYHIPDRLSDGYGLAEDTLRRLARDGAEIVVTVDCGITNVAEAAVARELGIELIVTDHHEFAADLPDTSVTVHPRLPGSRYPFPGLCGAGVAFKVAWALGQLAGDGKRSDPRMREYLLQAVTLAALGTVADVVPLVDENRVLVRHGLVSLRERPSLGLSCLMTASGLDKKPHLAAEDIAFQLAPRINAAGRLGQARLAVELLTTTSQSRAAELATYIEGLNATRKSLEQKIYLAARKQAIEEFDPESDAALVLAGRGWHVGVIGIVAGRLAEKFHRPVVLISQDESGHKPAVGSARNFVDGFNLHLAFQACSEHVVSAGGHAAAAGLKLEDGAIDAFRAEFCQYAEAMIPPNGQSAELAIDAETPLAVLTLKTLGHIDRLAPFGAGNARPLLSTTGVRLAVPPKRIGGGERHLSLTVLQSSLRLRAVAFGGGDWCEALNHHVGADSPPIAIAFHPTVNDFAGRRSVELELVDWKTDAPPP